MDTDRFVAAFRYAAELHRSQLRKGTDIPYISHLMAVAATVLDQGGDEDQAVAALLHDAIEDHPERWAHPRHDPGTLRPSRPYSRPSLHRRRPPTPSRLGASVRSATSGTSSTRHE